MGLLRHYASLASPGVFVYFLKQCITVLEGTWQGSYGTLQGSFGVLQGSFGVLQGSFGVLQGSFGVL